MQSRLIRRAEKQSKNQLYIYLAGLAIFLVSLVSFGPTIIGFIGNTLDAIYPKSQQKTITSDSSFQPPIFNYLPSATPSSSITISGTVFYQDGEVELFVNDSLYKKIDVDEAKTFSVKNVQLDEGENIIKARYKKNSTISDYSEEHKISYIKSDPKLENISPADKSSYSKSDQEITVTGNTDSDNSVYVNGFRAIVDNQGNFSYTIRLKNGDNPIKIEATNSVDRKTIKEISVTYSE